MLLFIIAIFGRDYDVINYLITIRFAGKMKYVMETVVKKQTVFIDILNLAVFCVRLFSNEGHPQQEFSFIGCFHQRKVLFNRKLSFIDGLLL